MKGIAWFVVAAAGFFAQGAWAQTVIHGQVTDARTGETLPSANIQIEGTYRGTITNAEGRYELRLDRLPATIIVRYIGYQSARRTITANTPARQDVRLEPSVLEMEELVVTGEDPAVNIMRKVIERKQQWWEDLRSYRVEAYNRFTVANDTGIVSIIETQTQAFWDTQRGSREVLTARRQTANLNIDEALPAALFVTNLYSDNVEVGGHELIGVTHPDALDHYRFRLDSTRAIDGRRVYDIHVEPKNKLTSAFRGRVSVLDEAYALLEVNLQPGEAFLFPPPLRSFDVRYTQQFSNFGGQFWLPVDFRARMNLDIKFSALLSFPTLHIKQVSRLSGYETNVPLPDSLYQAEKMVTVDTAAVQSAEGLGLVAAPVSDTLGRAGTAIPLSEAESEAYATIDSSMTLDKAFEPRGLLARFVDFSASADDEEVVSSEKEVGGTNVRTGITPSVWYNRVEALHAGGRGRLEIGRHFDFRAGGGYSTGPDGSVRWSYGGQATIQGGAETALVAEYRYGVDPAYSSALYGRTFNSVQPLTGEPDYYDYLGNERLRVALRRAFPSIDTEVRLQYNNERHFSVAKTTDYDLLGRDTVQPLNPSVEEGLLRSFEVQVTVGDEGDPLGIVGRNRLRLAVEYSNPDLVASAFDFTRFHLEVDGRIPTFFRRRLMPNVLDVRLVAGTFAGSLPVQRFGIVEASMRPFTPFGVLKTRDGRPYRGEQYVGVFWEHNFRTVPFEIVGLRGLAQRGYSILIHGGHGRTWVAEERQQELAQQGAFVPVPDGFHHEIGLSVSGVLGLFRVDLTKRLDAPGWGVGVSAARLF